MPGVAGDLEHLRVKAECLQVGGSVMFRGYQHFLLRSLGGFKGLVLHGSSRDVLAGYAAGALHRLPMIAVVAAELPVVLGSQMGDDIEVRVAADTHETVQVEAQARGFAVMPGLADEDVAAGVATLGLELAEELPAYVRRVLVAPRGLADPIRRGLHAGLRECDVEGVPTGDDDFGDLSRAVAAGVRVVSDPAGLAALRRALESEPDAAEATEVEAVCVVLSQ